MTETNPNNQTVADRKRADFAGITPEMVDDEITKTDFYTFPGSSHTICIITLKNGFTVTGETAAISGASFNKKRAQRIARRRANLKVVQLIAYQLKTDAYRESLRKDAVSKLIKVNADLQSDALVSAILGDLPR